ncbi:MAG: hypothetical protein QOJ81_1123 [Chloroflexota bacterium]|jgi:hypothetical protein|nr:hypothetical protein [Chloroflexota bacterium]
MGNTRHADKAATRGSASRRAAGGTGAPREMAQGGPQGNPRGPRDANDPGSTRYGKGTATGSNEPKDNVQKEQGDWRSRQGGDQSRAGR